MCVNESKVTQRYLYADWFFMGSEQSVQHVSCFDPLLQQPFLILRHSRSVPLFNEFFLNNPLSRIPFGLPLLRSGTLVRLHSPDSVWVLERGVADGGRGTQENDNEQARREFVAWFDEVKKSRVGERVRMCSVEERKARLNYNMALVKG